MNGSIAAITGAMGGGKTLYGVSMEMIPHVKRGGFVYSNIELHIEEIRLHLAECGLVLDPDRIRVFKGKSLVDLQANIGRGTHDMPVMVIFDEAALDGLNSRDWKDLNREFLNFNVLVRKLDIRMIYIAQKFHMLDKQVRDLCQTLVDCRNLKNFRLFGMIPFPIPLLVRVHHENTWGKLNKTHSDLVFSPKWAFKLYNSDALLGDAASKFASLEIHNATALQRIEQPPSPWVFPALTAFFVAFFVSV